jgi:hypothetical protein
VLIRVLSNTIGDEPRFVSEAWIGLVLPLAENVPSQPVVVAPAVLPTRALGLLARLKRRFAPELPDQPTPSFIVDANVGLKILHERHPEAAIWLRKNVPRLNTGE